MALKAVLVVGEGVVDSEGVGVAQEMITEVTEGDQAMAEIEAVKGLAETVIMTEDSTNPSSIRIEIGMMSN